MLEFEELRKLINTLDGNRCEIQEHLEESNELSDDESELLDTLQQLQDNINDWQESKGLIG